MSDHEHEHSEHDHEHTHSHAHAHAHSHEKTPLSLKEQLETLLTHWVGHNEAHKGTYLTWSERAREGGYAEAAELIAEIAEMTDSVTEKLKKTMEKVRTAP